MNDGQGTLFLSSVKLPTFLYNTQLPVDARSKLPPEQTKEYITDHLKVKCNHNLSRFLVAPDRKNVWMGGIRSLCEGVLNAKSYKSFHEDKGAYTVIPEIEGSSTENN